MSLFLRPNFSLVFEKERDFDDNVLKCSRLRPYKYSWFERFLPTFDYELIYYF